MKNEEINIQREKEHVLVPASRGNGPLLRAAGEDNDRKLSRLMHQLKMHHDYRSYSLRDAMRGNSNTIILSDALMVRFGRV